MEERRWDALAAVLLDHSLKMEKGEKLLVRGHGEALPLMRSLVRMALDRGVCPAYEIMDESLNRLLMRGATEETYELTSAVNFFRVEKADAVVNIFAPGNDYQFADVPEKCRELTQRMDHPFIDKMVREKKWVLINYPTALAAHKARMGTEAFADYLMKVCTVDYGRMKEALAPLKRRMDAADKVRICAPGTDLSFSIKGMGAVPCTGENNLPDGEIYTAPVLDSVAGTIRFNTPSPFKGHVFHNMEWVFENGRVVKASADEGTEALEAILSIDEGARRIGEFAFGLNPLIDEAMGDILFDEKINGSIHLALGQAYDGPADNGNRSVNHWDNILVLKDERGGGEIWFDGELIQKDGLFVPEELAILNALKDGFGE